MERFLEEGLLARSDERKGVGGSYIYTATMDERDLVMRAVHDDVGLFGIRGVRLHNVTHVKGYPRVADSVHRWPYRS
jgi:hypothetical protein